MYFPIKDILKQIPTALANTQPRARNSGARCKLGLSYLSHKAFVAFATFFKDP